MRPIHATLILALAGVVGCGGPPTPPALPEARATPTARHAIAIRRPAGAPVVLTAARDDKGQPITIACAICHTTKPPNADAKLGTALAAFHQTVTGQHGSLTCASCHNPADGYATLRLADGRSLPFTEVMTLCAQCHGPQFRDYQHGAHGGMAGYWDLSRGGRARANCVDCHTPHAPRYPVVTPAPGPNDRFQSGGGHE